MILCPASREVHLVRLIRDDVLPLAEGNRVEVSGNKGEETSTRSPSYREYKMAACPKCGTPTAKAKNGLKGCRRHGPLPPQFQKPQA